jgi:5-methylcytosine-specific restriction enzyme A
MPQSAFRKCLEPACSQLVRGASRCDAHAERKRAALDEKLRLRRALYRLPAWRQLRAAVLAEEPDCDCGCGGPTTVVDHISPHLGDLQAFLDRNNLKAMCKRSHDIKTSRFDSWNRDR